jgi:hypothetical protein
MQRVESQPIGDFYLFLVVVWCFWASPEPGQYTHSIGWMPGKVKEK